MLQTEASRYGSCYSCFKDVPGEIERIQAEKRRDVSTRIAMHEESIAQIHASDAFRAFVDSATLANARCADEQCRKDTAQEAEERSEIIRDEAFGRQRNEAWEAAKEAEALQYQERMVREAIQRHIWAEQAEFRLQRRVDEAIEEEC